MDMNRDWDREFYFYKKNPGDSFISQLFDLIAKADADNRFRLRVAFPDAVIAWEKWYNATSEAAHWKSMGYE